MENKNDEEKFIKLDQKDIQLLKKINKDDRYKVLKPVKELNDIIKDLKICLLFHNSQFKLWNLKAAEYLMSCSFTYQFHTMFQKRT